MLDRVDVGDAQRIPAISEPAADPRLGADRISTDRVKIHQVGDDQEVGGDILVQMTSIS